MSAMGSFGQGQDLSSSWAKIDRIRTQQEIVTSVLLVFMVTFLANRVYVKLWLVQQCRWDDGTLLMAVIGTLILYSTTLWISTRGNLDTDLHGNSIFKALEDDAFVTPAFVLLTVLPVTYGFLKATFFILYLQLFYQLRWMRVSAAVGLSVSVAAYTAFTVATLYLSVMRKIMVYGMVAIPISAFGLASDITILLLPIIAVANLNVSRRKKLGAVLIFLSGLLACICSVVALYFRTRKGTTENVVYLLFATNIAITCELMIGVMCACMPSLAYTYRNVQAFQGVRHRLSALIPPFVLRPRPATFPTIGHIVSDEDLRPVLWKSSSLSTKSVEDIELGDQHQQGAFFG
ncbi:hypothetical protein P171DRAFT_488618 [Karstenula rhodostoma CBS 690.94]|uniref:Rhodopsin domain-containing protein n=1 Tax=Karstenula rhodostoma CBS 690.94 TaxID=1392251 RepID=A0A9P4PDG8_9PLEO|nr:hypothetical protein P171DRAFT_488618 [Karstenula rhodostoma CBS 690.94]